MKSPNANNEPDWPLEIRKPKLPEGYEFLCLRQAWGIKGHPWWIRVLKGKVHLKIRVDLYFELPREAIAYAVGLVELDRIKFNFEKQL